MEKDEALRFGVGGSDSNESLSHPARTRRKVNPSMQNYQVPRSEERKTGKTPLALFFDFALLPCPDSAHVHDFYIDPFILFSPAFLFPCSADGSEPIREEILVMAIACPFLCLGAVSGFG